MLDTDVQKIIRAAIKDGVIAEMLPKIADQLRGAPNNVIRQAGQILIGKGAQSVVAKVSNATSVAIIGSATVDTVAPHIAGHLARVRILPKVFVSDYGQYLSDLLDPQSDLAAANPTVIVCILDAIHLLEQLPSGWSAQELESAASRLLSNLTSALKTFRQTRNGAIILNTIPLPVEYYNQVISIRERTKVSKFWNEFNNSLLSLSEKISSLYVIDMQSTSIQSSAITDQTLSRHARVHYTDDVFAEFSRQVAHVSRALAGASSKVLVLDLDDTMWGGTLAENGVSGLEPNGSTSSEAYKAVQVAAKQLSRQGVVLAICSKNDEATVLDAFNAYEGFQLTEDDFALVSADWTPKPARILLMAETLNLGVDSFVFADDNPSEIGAVNAAAPVVATILMSQKEPALNLSRLMIDSWFLKLDTTDDDRVRNERYRVETRRASLQQTAGSHDDYLASLETVVSISEASDLDFERLSQITMRTNQFNATTVRMDKSSVENFARSPRQHVFTVRCKDAFGDHGLVATAFVTIQDSGILTLENYLMSCRVMQRGVEFSVIDFLVKLGRKEKCERIVTFYRESAKNDKSIRFIEAAGFCKVDPCESVLFRLEPESDNRPISYELLISRYSAAPELKYLSLECDT
ncbi:MULTISPECIES: HAD-IIIC family phosphatase [Enterobacteriaceae]|uniref:HAD-IIIC family phosphatase n=1 Tax=Enterobacteriaceae TaxID=543 RepID=UPI000667FAB4|nr:MULTISPECIES: HAD-IIIC family phosphatase [Enterobacteriaceae]MCZ9381389.1 HAD-IIIC family phosphatase [Klebsiella pneumoniae]OVH09327.1 hypothetical protein B8Z90_05705 [Klebsiella pneumoniae]OVH13150.1 hypothetical protein B8000_21130 [Klebsiella pneumoniae]HBY1214571.1 HAD-IIIC family phosphatase [Klebsiella pneumoniae]HBY1270427.1 HAD-IIIC family phosphatase [Klebsiella pneumoniae]